MKKLVHIAYFVKFLLSIAVQAENSSTDTELKKIKDEIKNRYKFPLGFKKDCIYNSFIIRNKCSFTQRLTCKNSISGCKCKKDTVNQNYYNTHIAHQVNGESSDCYEIASSEKNFTCKFDEQCKLSELGKFSTCSEHGTCECISKNGSEVKRFENVCFLKKDIGSECFYNIECSLFISGSICSGGRDKSCQCERNSFYYGPLNKCLKNSKMNEDCEHDSQCFSNRRINYYCHPILLKCMETENISNITSIRTETQNSTRIVRDDSNRTNEIFTTQEESESKQRVFDRRTFLELNKEKIKISSNRNVPQEILIQPKNFTQSNMSEKISELSSNQTTIVIAVASSVLIIVLIFGSLLYYLQMRKTKKIKNDTYLELKKLNDKLKLEQTPLDEPPTENVNYENINGESFSDNQHENFIKDLEIDIENCMKVSAQDFKINFSIVLGSGNFGSVYECHLKNKRAAVKVLNLDPFNSAISFKLILNETKIMTRIGKHPNIVNFLGVHLHKNKNTVYLFTEICQSGDLSKYLKEIRYNLDDISLNSQEHEKNNIQKDLNKFAYQIASGMTYLESKNIIHGDLASRNCLLMSDSYVKISDFGLALKIYNYSSYIKRKDGEKQQVPWKWMPYEVLTDEKFSTKSDVWSFGILLWELFSLGLNPYPGQVCDNKFITNLKNGKRLEKPQLACLKIYELMNRCWEHQVEKRPTFYVLKKTFIELIEKEDDVVPTYSYDSENYLFES